MTNDLELIPVIGKLEDLFREPSVNIGSVISMDYESATIASNDFKIQTAGGIPQRCFLLAVPHTDEGEELDEIVLLSVSNVAQLESARGFQALREDFALSGQTDIDLNTRSNLENVGFKCHIVGTFFTTNDGVRFGSDVDGIRGNSLFSVYKPRGHSLSLIGSYSHSNGKLRTNDDTIEIGEVRYAETRRHSNPEAKVFVNVEDFIGKKSAVLGMTRSGKSNTIKTIVQKVFQYSHQHGRTPIGQIIFDPQGEYANANSQDGFSALADVGDDDEVHIYKMLNENKNKKEHHLQFNLFNADNLDLTWRLMTGELRSGVSSEANYITTLFELSFSKPTESSSQEAWGIFKRKQLALYALMHRCKFQSEVKEFSVYVGPELAKLASDQESLSEIEQGEKLGSLLVSSTNASLELFNWLIFNENKLPDFWRVDLKDGTTGEVKSQLAHMDEGRNGVLGAFNRIRPLHNANSNGDVREKIWRDLTHGRLVIVDLSRGSSRTTTILSEMIVRYLVDNSSKNFTQGLEPIPFQIIVEEAHNLFQREGQKDEGQDPWVRLSKEAAKYHIGLVYATQEVSSVDQKILSNTSNWVISHLNSRNETRELAKYYSFEEWSDHLLKVETKGFVRMKTESSPYIVPVQIELFRAEPHGAKSSKKVKTEEVIEEPEYDVDNLNALFE